jgi:hypothetical protein
MASELVGVYPEHWRQRLRKVLVEMLGQKGHHRSAAVVVAAEGWHFGEGGHGWLLPETVDASCEWKLGWSLPFAHF